MHGRIEKPKSVTSATCFDRSSLRADERFYLSDAIFPAFPAARLLSSVPFTLFEQTTYTLDCWLLLARKGFIHLEQILVPFIIPCVWFASKLLFRQFYFLFPSFFFVSPRLASLLASPSISLTLVIISIPNQFYRHPPPSLLSHCCRVIELQGVNCFEYCSRSIRELMGATLPI